MKRVFFVIFSVLTSFSSQSIENLEFPIEPIMAKEWKYQSDQVMGGVSQGDASLVQDGDMFFSDLLLSLIHI